MASFSSVADTATLVAIVQSLRFTMLRPLQQHLHEDLRLLPRELAGSSPGVEGADLED
jgi:hypothetical protein